MIVKLVLHYRHVHGKKVLVVTNTTVAPLYLEKTIWALTHENPDVTVETVILRDGEKYKNMVSMLSLLRLRKSEDKFYNETDMIF